MPWHNIKLLCLLPLITLDLLRILEYQDLSIYEPLFFAI